MKFRKSFEVRFSEADRRSLLTPIALFNYLQEAAIGHGDAVGLEGESLAEMGYMWMLNRIHFRINQYPSRRDTVHVETWGSTLTGLYAVREWNLTGDDGQKVASATARWILVDTQKGKIIKLPEILAERYGVHEGRGLDDNFERMSAIESGEFQKRFHVRLSELDSNQHANSASYIDWCLEAVPEDVLNSYLPQDLEITFKKESKLGDGLIASSLEEPSGEQGYRVFLHAIRNEVDDTLLTIGKSTWQKAE